MFRPRRGRTEILGGMTDLDAKANHHRYLREARGALLGKLDGLSEYDMRRPLVPTGTNLLGLVKHVATVTAGYFGEVFDRPFPESVPGLDQHAELNRHAGHADIVRELIDGQVGWRRPGDTMVEADEAWWAAHRERLERIARGFGG
jgi:hypothetical protein